MQNSIKSSCEYDCLIFHGFSFDKVLWHGFIDEIIFMLSLNGLLPTLFSFSTKTIADDQMHDFHEHYEIFRKYNKDDLQSFCIQITTENSLDGLNDDIISIDCIQALNGTLSIVINNSYFTLENEIIFYIIDVVNKLVDSHYGYCARNVDQADARLYYAGISYNLNKNLYGLDFFQERWNLKYLNNICFQNDIRDFFEINLLSKEHLQLEIDRQTNLYDLINSYEGYGALKKIEKEKYLWLLDVSEISNIKKNQDIVKKLLK